MAPKIGRQSDTFGDYLRDVEGINFNNPDEESEIFQLLTTSKELEVMARGFRVGAQSTQARQDRILAWYRLWVKKAVSISETLPEEEALDLACFPNPEGTDFRQLFQQIRMFLAFAVSKSVPVHTEDEVDRKYKERRIEPPKRWEAFDAMTEMMRLLQRHYKIAVSRHRKVNRTLLGTWEILQMMDHDIRTTTCIELAECHHLAWVLGRAAALRPGSLARSPKQTQELPYLVWRDLSIERTSTIGKFIVRLRIRNLKTNSIDPEVARTKNKDLLLSLHCPNGQLTFELSAPHRILTIALRRGALKNISTIKELFEAKEKFIQIADGFLDKPILIAGKERGFGADPDKPMASYALTEYIQLRAKAIGFIEHITFYSLRRNTAQSLVNSLGSDMARAIMAHDPSTTTLEHYYITDRTSHVDLTAIVTGESSSVNREDKRPSLALTKLSSEQILKLGPMLNELFNELREGDNEYPHQGSKQQRKNRDRVLRRAAWRSVLKDINNAQTETLTQEEIRHRAKDLEAMRNEFNSRLLDQAKRYITDHPPQDDKNEAPDAADMDFDHDFAEDVEEIPETDAESQFAAQVESGQIVETFPDEVQDVAEDVSALEYATAARAAMEVWLAIGTNESVLGTKFLQKSICQLCVDDETMDHEAKTKIWEPHHLTRHQKSGVHSRFKEFSRRVQRYAKENQLSGVVCEICAMIAPEDIILPTYLTVSTVARHIKESSHEKLIAIEADCAWWRSDGFDPMELAIAHDELKHAAGWYDDDFRGSSTLKKQHRIEAKTQAIRRHAKTDKTLAFSAEKELAFPIPMTSKYPSLTANIQHGSQRGWQKQFLEEAGGRVILGKSEPLEPSKLFWSNQFVFGGRSEWELPAHYLPLVETRPPPSHLGGRERSIMSKLKDVDN
ncbi:hypothetical protein H9Q69_001037 [Fusarium xylarioides]|nr:hypothetical protein H9Q69_001037 [Fusarium xylarioides]